MKKVFLAFALILTAMFVTGCTSQVPPGYVGKKIGVEGVHPEIYETGRVSVYGRDRLILIESASVLRPAPLTVIMADRYVDESGKEQVRPGAEMKFQLNVRYRVNPEPAVINAALKDMKLSASVNSIEAADFYEKYGGIVVGKVGREVLGKYTPREVLNNLDAINAALFSKLKDGLKNTPLLLSEAALGPVQLPAEIQSQINENLKTEESKVKKRAEQEIALLEKQNQIELAKQQAVREEVDALSLANQNDILRRSITPEVLRLRELQIREKEIDMMGGALANKGNNTVFIPYGAIDSAGAQMRMFQK